MEALRTYAVEATLRESQRKTSAQNPHPHPQTACLVTIHSLSLRSLFVFGVEGKEFCDVCRWENWRPT
jgi:hypothetical protein